MDSVAERSGPSHHAHDHDHRGHHDHRAPALRSPLRLSLLRMSAAERLAGAAGVSGFIWLAVWWALG